MLSSRASDLIIAGNAVKGKGVYVPLPKTQQYWSLFSLGPEAAELDLFARLLQHLA